MSAVLEDWFSTQSLNVTWGPLLATLFLHGLLAAALTSDWEPSLETEKLFMPQHVQATLIDAAQLRPKPKPKPVPVIKPKPKPKAEKPKVTPIPEVKKPTETVPDKPKVVPQEEIPPARDSIFDEEAARAEAAAEMANALAAEDVLLEAVGDLEAAQGHVATIARAIENNWSRPPSARNGMQAELLIFLIPTGEVVSVMVDRSSGSSAFDRSAVNAVQKAERFPELQDLPIRVFEKHFRRLRLKFRPEDLRQ